ncbi:GIY-YIG nuclease family protein [Streptomyces virginiae]|uniref:GIY-YIG nuclease family protein n=1 Tax=Streptomyces virginiae TaxID=1961 RepID=UPI0036485E89
MTRKLTRPNRVYLIGDPKSMRVKIGIASDPKRRLSEIQTGNPVKLVILAVFHGTARTERDLHKRFSDRRLSGEWFNFLGLDPVQAVTAAGLTRDTDYPLWEPEDPDKLSKEFVQEVEAAFGTEPSKGFRFFGWVTAGLVVCYTVISLVATWAMDDAIFGKVMLSLFIPLLVFCTATADIANRRQALDMGSALGVMYLTTAVVSVLPIGSYLWQAATDDTKSHVIAALFTLKFAILPPLVLHACIETFHPELDERVKERLRAERQSGEKLRQEKYKAINYARSLRRYYEMRGDALSSPAERAD